MPLEFLIIDGYAKASREEFDVVGMKYASVLYGEMLKAHLPEAEYTFWYPSDNPEPPAGPEAYAGILWTGCNLTVYHDDNPSVARQLAYARKAYEVGTPSFGTCWGLQIAAVAAGGEVKANPKGREMGIARKIRVTEEGSKHPMLAGKRAVYNAFISHLDEVTRLPEGARLLSTNDFTGVQALEIRHAKGIFWATQYHPEYDLHEMARLIQARAKRLLAEGFFRSEEDLKAYVDNLETLNSDPARKDLRWQLDIDDDVLVAADRQLEFRNWIHHVVLPNRRGA